MSRMIIESPLGRLALTSDEKGICEIALAGELPGGRPDAVLEEAAKQLEEYFAGSRAAFDLPLSLRGSAFDCTVWQALGGIGFGELCTYGELAAKLGKPKSARAVGGACGRNPLLIVLPCHRVVSSSGRLTGFAAGLDAKRTLLAHEGWEMEGESLLNWKK